MSSQVGGGEPGGSAESTVVLECPAGYQLEDQRGGKLAGGDAKVRLDEETLSVLPNTGTPLFLSYRDVLDFSLADYALRLGLVSGETLTVRNLGYKFEDLVRVFSRLRNEVLLKDLLMNEPIRKAGVGATFVRYNENSKLLGNCQLRLYDTALVLIPEGGELTRIPYSYITEVRGEDYVLSLVTEFGERIALSRMGENFEPVKRGLSDAMNELGLKVQASLKELIPDAAPSAIWKAAGLMKEGKAASRGEIESVSPELWTQLEKRLEVVGVKEEYEFLKAMSQKDQLCIGLKRGLMGDLTGDYIWFLIPIYSQNPNEPGNAIAMEASSGEGEGRATYFFRMLPRTAYKETKEMQVLHNAADSFIKTMNRCMLEINFRREPIYLPDEKLQEPQYTRYRFAVKKIQALRTLRSLYVGRVIHSSPDQWKQDVTDLLKFNSGAPDDSAKWSRASINPHLEEE